MRNIVIFFFLLLLADNIWSQPIFQWRGQNGSGIYNEAGLLKSWPETGPKLIWSASGIGKGYSSVVANDNGVFVTGIKDTLEYLYSFNHQGTKLWETSFGRAWGQSFPESRCSPTIEGNNIYVVSGAGSLACLNTNDGKIKWSFNGIKKFNGAYGEWGVCESLLIFENMLFYTPAGTKTTMVALNKNTGETIWESESLSDTSAYVSPILINFGNKKIVVNLISNHLFGVDVSNGNILFKYKYSALKPEISLSIWPGGPKTNTINPLYKDGFIYITAGYDHVGAMFKLSEKADKIDLIWTDSVLDCHHGGVVLIDNYIYGSNWINNGNGNWCCIDWKTGKKMYEQSWNCKGSIIAADGLLYCYDEKKGNVGLVKPDPQKFDLISSFKITKGSGPHWAHPSIYKGILYIRHGEAILAFDIKNK